ncbi:MAG TPA: ABC transporter permease [Candidatus Limnocylindrales bacterium]|nr:ABC transporter permease [Candidatus Limnocylindrales bacterium]
MTRPAAAAGPRAAGAAGGAAAPTFDLGRTRGRGLSDTLRTFRVAVRLGWQLEANWTDPLLFFIYSVAKPVSSALILVVMLEVIGGPAGRAFRPFVVVGSALWAFVISGIAGLAWAILEDRERYRVLKYVYVSPSDFLTVLVGRGVARIAVGLAGVAITLVVGVVALGVPFDVGLVNWPLLVASFVLGVAAIIALGLLMAGVCIQTRQESWSYPEAFAGALFLVTGAVFPLTVLPSPVQLLGLVTPLTWWIAGIREALFPGGPDSIGGAGSLFETLFGHPNPTGGEIVLALLATGAVATLAALAVFRLSDRRAKRAGLYDRTTGS